MLADVFAIFNWALLPEQPWIAGRAGAAGAAAGDAADACAAPGEAFALLLRADDRWGNPRAAAAGRYRLRASAPVAGLPEASTGPKAPARTASRG